MSTLVILNNSVLGAKNSFIIEHIPGQDKSREKTHNAAFFTVLCRGSSKCPQAVLLHQFLGGGVPFFLCENASSHRENLYWLQGPPMLLHT